MGGIMGIAAALFGVFWTIMAASMGGGIFAMFGLVFIGVAVIQAVYNFKNATGKNRYSAFDITEGDEEADPLNERFGAGNYNNAAQDAAWDSSAESCNQSKEDNAFCPYCGTKVEKGYVYCNKCGKKLP